MGVSVKKGRLVPSFGVGGQEILYFHDIKVGVVIDDQVWKFSCSAGFSVKMNPKGTGLLGRKGFFDLFEEVVFEQQKRVFKLHGEGSRLFEEETE